MGKYDYLGTFLAAQNALEVALTFAEIEEIIGTPLPPSAHRHRPWWSNNGQNSAMTRVWLKAGFRSERVDLPGERLVFVRKDVSSPAAVAPSPWPPRNGRHPALGALKGMLTIMPGVDITAPADPEWGERLYAGDATANDLVGGLDDR